MIKERLDKLKIVMISMLSAVILLICGLFFIGLPQQKDKSTQGALVTLTTTDFEYSDTAKTILTGLSSTGLTKYNKSTATNIQLTIPSTVQTISTNAFNGYTKIKAVTLNLGLRTINDRAFNGCTGLTNIEIPVSVTKIGTSTSAALSPFNGCTKLAIIIAASASQMNTLKSMAGLTSFADKLTYKIEIQFKNRLGTTEHTATKLYGKSINYTYSEGNLLNPPGWSSKTFSLPEGNWYDEEGNLVTVSDLDTKFRNGEITSTYVLTALYDIIESDFSLSWTTHEYTGGTLTPTLTSSTLSKSDYTYTIHKGSAKGTEVSAPKDAGDYVMVINGQDAYSGQVNLNFTITKATAAVVWDNFQETYNYTGTAFPTPTAHAQGVGSDGLINLTVTQKPEGELKELGSYTFTASFSDSTMSTNYTLSNTKKTCTITAKESILDKAEDFTYDDNGQLTGLSTQGQTKVTYSETYKIIFPDAIKSFKDYTASSNSPFKGDEKLTSIDFASGSQVIKIGDFLFDSCSNLQSVNIPNNVQSIGGCAFQNCSSIIDFTIPDEVISIGDAAFMMCKKLQTVKINPTSKLKTIGSAAFTHTKLKNILIPDSLTDIEEQAFDLCNDLERVEIGENSHLTNIGQRAFGDFVKLKSIYIPNSVSQISAATFFPSGLEVIVAGNQARVNELLSNNDQYNLQYCASLVTYPIEIQFKSSSGTQTEMKLWNKSIQWCRSSSNVWTKNAGYTMPKAPAGYVWYDAAGNYITQEILDSKLTNGDITGTYVLTASYPILDKAEDFTYDGNGQLTGISTVGQEKIASADKYSIIFPTEIKSFQDYTGNIRSPFYNDNKLTSVEFASSTQVTKIGINLFSSCSNLQSVKIPSNIQSIGNMAFVDCSNLTNVTLVEGLTSIGDNAFANCINLVTINIPNSLQTLGNGAFSGCTALETVNINQECNMQSIGALAFSGCSQLIGISISDKVTEIGNLAFQNCIALGKVKIWETSTLKTINEKVFEGCTGLKNITLPDSLISIGKEAFSGCSNLSLVNINDSSKLQTIGDAAFVGCTSLLGFTIPDEVISIGMAAFSTCTSFQTVQINPTSKLNTIGSGAFVYTKLKSIFIPDSVTDIGDQAFEYCEELERVEISENSHLTNIGQRAFGSFDKLTSIFIPNSVSKIADNTFWTGSSLQVIVVGNKARASELLSNNDQYHLQGCETLVTYPVEIQFKGTSSTETQYKLHGKDVGWCRDTANVWTLNSRYKMPDGNWYDTEGNLVTLTDLNNKLTKGEIDGVYVLTSQVKITDADFEFDWSTKVYNGAKQVPNITSTTLKEGNYTVSIQTSPDGTVEMNPTNVGSYVIVITGVAPYVGTVTHQFNITPATVTLTWSPAEDSITYTGKVIADPTATAQGLGSDKLEITVSKTSPADDFKDVGSYTFTAEIQGDISKNYVLSNGEKTYKIVQAGNSWTKELTMEGWTYGEEAKEPEAEAKFGIVTFKYATSQEGEYKDEKPTNAGTYWVKATVAGTADYEGLEATVEFNISKAQVAVKWAVESEYTYTGEARKKPTATADGVNGDGTLTLDVKMTKSPEGAEEFKNAGDYTFTASLREGNQNNYEISGEATKEITVKRATVTLTWSPADENITYTGKVIDNPTVSGNGVGSDELKFTVSKTNPAAEFKEVGSYTFKAEIQGDIAKNYVLSNGTKTYTIVQAEVEIIWTKSESYTYTGEKQQEPTAKARIEGSGVEFELTVEMTNPQGGEFKNAGEYTFTARMSEVSCKLKEGAETSVTVKIERAKVNVEWTKSESYTYTGEEQGKPTAKFTGVGSEGEIDLEVNMTKSPENDEKFKNAGDYTFTASLKSDNQNNYELENNITLNVTIEKASLKVEWEAEESYEYTGEVQNKPTATAKGLGSDGDFTLDVSMEQGTEFKAVGSYTFTAAFKKEDAERSKNYELESAEITRQITKVSNSWTKELTMDGWTYGEDAKEPEAEAKFGSVTFKYATSQEGEYGDEKPTNAGTYWVKATVEGTEDYAGIEATKEFTISRAKVAVKWTNEGSYTYTGYEQEKPTAKFTGVNSEGEIDLDVTITNSPDNDEKFKNAGDYTFTASLSSANQNNYEISGEATKEITVKPATVTLTWSPEDENITYTGKVIDNPTVSGEGVGSDKLEFSVSKTNPAAEFKEVGSYTFTATIDGDLSKNYVLSNGTKTYTIVQAGNSWIKELTMEGWTYGEEAKEPSAEARFGEVKFSYATSKEGDYGDEKPTNAGTYWVKATVVGTDDYAGIEATVEFNISKAQVAVKWAVESEYTYTGEVQNEPTATAQGVNEDGTLTLDVKMTKSPEGAGEFKNAGDYTFTASLKSANQNNYEISGEATKEITVNPATVTLTWSPESDSITYTGEVIDNPTVSGEGVGSDELKFTVSKTNPAAEFKEVGSYTFTATIDGDLSKNYVLSNGTKTYKIEKAGNSWTKELTMEGWTYGEEAKEPSAEARFGAVKFSYATSQGGEYGEAKPTNAGTYWVKATVEGTDDYERLEETVEFNISKAKVVVEWAVESEYTYTSETINPPTATADGVNGDGTLTLDVKMTKSPEGAGEFKNAGDYTFTASLKSENQNNYEISGEATKEITVKRATVTLTWSPEGENITYTGKVIDNPTATTQGLGSDELVITVNKTSPADDFKEVGSYTFKAEIQGDIAKNYVLSNGTKTYKIVQAGNSWTKELTMEGWTYGEEAKEPSAEARFGEVKFSYATSKEGDYVEDKPTNAGTYWVKATVEGTDDYAGIEATVEFNISKAKVDVKWTNEESYTYTGYEQGKPTAKFTGVNSEGEINLEVKMTKSPENAGEFKNVGDYTFTASLKSANQTNYELENNITLNVTIRKASLKVEWEAEASYEYNGEAQNKPTAKAKGLGSDGDFTLDVSMDPGTEFKAVGSYTFTAAFKESDSARSKNYELESAEIRREITKVNNSWEEAVGIDGWTYGGEASNPRGRAKFGSVTFTYSEKENEGFTESKPTNAGTYWVKATVAGTADYEGLEATVEFNISKAKVAVKWAVESEYTYTSETINPPTATAQGVNGDGTLRLDVNMTKSPEGAEEFKNAGDYTFTASLKSDNQNNYEISGEATKEIKINRKQMTDELFEKFDATYPYSQQEVVLNYKLVLNNYQMIENVDYHIVYVGRENAPTEQGQYEVEFIGDGNFVGSVTKSFTITKLVITENNIHYTTEFVYAGVDLFDQLLASINVEVDDIPLVYQTDYYVEKVTHDTKNILSDNGVKMFKVRGTNNFAGEVTLSFTIMPRALDKASMLQVTSQSYRYSQGQEIKPEYTLKFNDVDLRIDTDYIESFENNTQAGQATMILTGRGNFSGDITFDYQIEKGTPQVHPVIDEITNPFFAGEDAQEYTISTSVGDTAGQIKFNSYLFTEEDSQNDVLLLTWIFQPYDENYDSISGQYRIVKGVFIRTQVDFNESQFDDFKDSAISDISVDVNKIVGQDVKPLDKTLYELQFKNESGVIVSKPSASGHYTISVLMNDARYIITGQNQYEFYIKATYLETAEGIVAYNSEDGFEEGVVLTVVKITDQQRIQEVLGNLYNKISDIQYIYTIKFTKNGEAYQVTNTYLKLVESEKLKIYNFNNGILNDLTIKVNNGENLMYDNNLSVVIYQNVVKEFRWGWLIAVIVVGSITLITVTMISVYVIKKKKTQKMLQEKDNIE